jgi:hypothetical protein
MSPTYLSTTLWKSAVRRRYVQVLSLIFSFTSTYNDHSAHYASIASAFGALGSCGWWA